MILETGIKTKIENFEDIERIANKIAKINGVKAVYLFGSYARDETHNFSDVDLCVFLDKKNKKAELDVMGYCSDNVDISFFHRLPLAIRFRVFGEGKLLIVKDENFIMGCKKLTLGEYLDFKPHLHRMCMEKLKCMI